MLILNLISIFIFFVQKISNQDCTEEICWHCLEMSSNKIMNCICSECPSLNSKCFSDECDTCKNFPKKIFFHYCLCDTCNKSLSVVKIVIISSAIVLAIIIGILIIIYFIRKQKQKKERQRERERERILRNRNMNATNTHNRNIIIDTGNNNNIHMTRNARRNSHNNNEFISNRNLILNFNIGSLYTDNKIINNSIKEISLDEILSYEKYLGPKLCKKEYQKHNSTCTICLEKFKEDIDMVSLTPCFHLFHSKCLDIFFRKNKNAKCPNCNFDIINHFRNQI